MKGVKSIISIILVGTCTWCIGPNYLFSQKQSKSDNLWTASTDSLRSLGENFPEHSDYFEALLHKTDVSERDSIENFSFANFCLNLGYHYETYDHNYYRALELYQKGKSLLDKRLDFLSFPSWAFAVHSMANIYTRFGDYIKAAHLFQILSDERKNRNPNDPYLEGLYLDHALALHSGGQTEKAMQIITTNQFKNSSYENYAHILQAEMLISQSKITGIPQLLDRIHDQIQQLPNQYLRPTKVERLISYYECKSTFEYLTGDYNQAYQSIQLALQNHHQIRGRLIAKTDLKKAKILLAQNKHSQAIAQLDSCIMRLGFDLKSFFKQPPIQLENVLVENYSMRGDILTSQFLLSRKISSVKDAIFWYRKSVEVDFFIRDQLNFEKSKSQINASNKAICKNAIDACIAAFAQTKDSAFIVQAFYFSEFNKAANLRDELSNRFRHKKQNIDTFYTQQLSLLESQLALLLRQQRLGNSSAPNLNRKISDLQLQISSIEKPSISFARSGTDIFDITTTVETIQEKLLMGQSSFVTYFFSPPSLHRFYLNGRTIQLDTFNLYQKDNELIAKLGQLSAHPINSQNEWNEYTSLNQTYLPIFYHPDFDKTLVHYSLDGILHSISIPSLLVESATSTHSNNYLIHQYAIAYQYSPSVWSQLSQVTDEQVIFNHALLVAPESYQNESHTVLPLDDEKIMQHIPATNIDVTRGSHATFEQIRDRMTDVDLLHFHTHGSFSPYNMIECFDQPMFVDEVKTASLTARLAVLSACETGVGITSSTEGPQSMARGFAQAGVPTTIMTLWKVNNQVTQDILAGFYRHLNAGTPSTEALRMAQLDYLDNHQGVLNQPYYWSGILHSGPVVQLRPKNKWYFPLILALFIGLTIIAFLLGRRHKKRAQPD